MKRLLVVGVVVCCLLGVVPPQVAGRSNGDVEYCDVASPIGADTAVEEYEGEAVMKWVTSPVLSAAYELTAPDSSSSYAPDSLIAIQLRVTDLDMKYIGLVLYAEDDSGTKVGSWELLSGIPFFTPSTCRWKAVVHTNADLKRINTVFHFRAPAANTGTITFKALVKQGEQAKGDFYWPNELTLTEGAVSGPQVVFKGSPGASCDHTCAEADMACDKEATTSLSNTALLSSAISGNYACRQPIVKGCGAQSPTSGADDWCWFKDESCADTESGLTATACSTRIDLDSPVDNERFCACKPGSTKFDKEDTVKVPTEASLSYEVRLDTDFVIHRVDLKAGNVTVQFTGPAEKWIGMGWGGYWMEDTYATIVSSAPPADVQARHVDMEDSGWSDLERGWYDAQCQGVLNDFCRWEGWPLEEIEWYCALAGGSVWDQTYSYEEMSQVPCDADTREPLTLSFAFHEAILGDHHMGSTLTQSVHVTEMEVVDGMATYTWTRKMEVDDARAYQFSLEDGLKIPFIWSIGSTANFNFDGKHDRKMDTLSPVVLELWDPKDPESPANDPNSPHFQPMSAGERRKPGYAWLFLGAVSVAFLALPTSSSSSISSSAVLFVAAVLTLITLSPTPCQAHNWVIGPSRASVASVSKPCQTRIDVNPHVQVGPGQQFELEWTQGHGGEDWSSPTYFVAIKAEDYEMLHLVENMVLEDYFSQAPESAEITGSRYSKVHVGFQDGDSESGPESYKKELFPGDSAWVDREEVMHEKGTSSRDDPSTYRQYEYLPEHVEFDRRVEYSNPTYPWIISAHKFYMYHHYPSEWDISYFALPDEPGDYIYHFFWAGYRDCVDVNVHPDQIENRYGLVPDEEAEEEDEVEEVRYARLDHCEFTYVQNTHWNAQCHVMEARSAQECLDKCSIDEWCTAVQAVRVTNPPAPVLDYTPSIPWTMFEELPEEDDDGNMMGVPNSCQQRTIHTRRYCPEVNDGCDQSALGAGDGDFVCYGFWPYRDQDFQVAEDYVTTLDWEDPKFYSTCWTKLAPGGFIDIAEPVKKLVDWAFGDKCITCEKRAEIRDMDPATVPDWEAYLTDDCSQCDYPTHG